MPFWFKKDRLNFFPAKYSYGTTRTSLNFSKLDAYQLLPPTVNMSRFFRGDSSSESSSDEEEDLYSDDEEVQEQPEEESEDDDSEEDDDDSDSSSDDDGVGKKTGPDAFLKGNSDSESESSSDEGVKVVKSAKNKRFEELEATAKAIENGEKINDWGSISAGQ